jgi:putative flippase GtrA
VRSTIKFLTYAAIGGSCTLVNLVVLWLLTSVLGLHYLVSTMISFFTLTPVGFWLNKILTFRTPREFVRVEWPRYVATMALSFGANLVLMYLLVTVLGLWYLAASLVVALTLLVVNFLANDRWSFEAGG